MGLGIIPLIFIVMFAPELISLAFPVIFFVGLITIIKKAVNSNKSQGTTNRKNANSNARYGYSARTSQTKNDANTLSLSELTKIDKKLESYFRENVYLNIIEGIALTTQKGSYTTLDELYVTYKDEKICKLSELKSAYPAIYNKIQSLLVAFSKQKNEVLREEVTVTAPKKTEKISDARKFIDRIDTLNQSIPNEEITNGLYQTSNLLKQIDLTKSDKKEDKLNKLNEYYLPLLIGILEKYDQLDDSPIRNEEFYKVENQLIKTIILINEALKSIYNSLHEEDYMNLNADITTLESLLKKDGLVDQPFGGN